MKSEQREQFPDEVISGTGIELRSRELLIPVPVPVPDVSVAALFKILK